MKTGVLAGACLAALLPLAARAQTPSAAPRPLVGGHGDNVAAFIAEHDADGDGKVGWAEFEAFRRARFDATDRNRDGVVDEAEYVQEFDARLHEQLRRERAAQVEQARTRFAALDADQDGKVSRREFDQAGGKTWEGGQRALAGEGKAAPADASRTRSGQAGRLLRMPTSHTAEGFLALYDENGDGKVERAEFDRVRDAQFDRADADRDGALALDEYLAEYEARLDERIATLTRREDRQVRVRFGVLDADKDGRMTFAEYQASGKRLFETADRNRDGVVDASDLHAPAAERRRSD
ncbi:EF-hand domain-containing protein [[Pseudomonas] boreopolis]|uniref:EF-hand domain-containing protein n=1 Tax=Xanthomonas boreopolis TaxID=86183 RepID=A0A919FCK8_9XANT|nr:hypothetical protein GCM10009090_35680 [[Pseudomonas] boreopolis]